MSVIVVSNISIIVGIISIIIYVGIDCAATKEDILAEEEAEEEVTGFVDSSVEVLRIYCFIGAVYFFKNG